MDRKRIDSMDFPPNNGESWWIVHPNCNTANFRIPSGACTLCLNDFLDFKKNTVYSVISADNHNGWVTVVCANTIYDMPQYLFARNFDAESFVVGNITAEEIERSKVFDYKATLEPFPTEFKG